MPKTPDRLENRIGQIDLTPAELSTGNEIFPISQVIAARKETIAAAFNDLLLKRGHKQSLIRIIVLLQNLEFHRYEEMIRKATTESVRQRIRRFLQIALQENRLSEKQMSQLQAMLSKIR